MVEGGGPSNLQQRFMSAAVLIVVVLALTWLGGVWFRLLAVVIGAAVFYEWCAMMHTPEVRQHQTVLAVLLAVLLAALLAGAPAAYLLGLLLAGLVLGAVMAAKGRHGPWHVAGLAYAGLLALSLALLRGADQVGLAAILFLFAVVWATDIMAYFTGRALGGPKLAPSISPGKTWSGAIGGALAAVIAGGLAARYAGASWGLAATALFTLVLSAVSQAGDLFESSLKRRFGVKDSSRLIPGHGGVMDRVDALAAAAVAMFVAGALAAGPDAPAQAFFAR